MNVLVVGSGGREHALCWKLAQSESLRASRGQLFCAPGNPGTAQVATNIAIAADDFTGLLKFARECRIDLTVVGPEAPLCAGIQDRFAEAGLLVFGPSQAAAQLEGSKIFSKEFMTRMSINTAPYGVFSDVASAHRYIDDHPRALVVKVDGLAAGKGVVVAKTPDEAKQAVVMLLSDGNHKRRILVEEKLVGEELSVMATSDGERVQIWEGSQDHKTLYDGDRGPNTGGMGAYSPAPRLTPALRDVIYERVLRPTVDGMRAAGTPYRGILYAGVMLVGDNPFVLEFNCRLGDPETQPLLMRWKSDLLSHCLSAARGQLTSEPLRWDSRAALCVVMAAPGYPDAVQKGATITGLDENTNDKASDESVVVFHAGTARREEQTVTSGGRVLGVTALGNTLADAKSNAYARVAQISWPGAQYRKDIGWRAL